MTIAAFIAHLPTELGWLTVNLPLCHCPASVFGRAGNIFCTQTACVPMLAPLLSICVPGASKLVFLAFNFSCKVKSNLVPVSEGSWKA